MAIVVMTRVKNHLGQVVGTYRFASKRDHDAYDFDPSYQYEYVGEIECTDSEAQAAQNGPIYSGMMLGSNGGW